MQEVVYDFHTHSLLSDGELTPSELIRRAMLKGYRAIAVTDHVDISSLLLLPSLIEQCALIRQHWDVLAIPGVELTHLPVEVIPIAAKKAKEMGAWLVVVHGETVVERVPQGTNLAALTCPYVDILAHPGLLTPEEAALAATNGVFLELSARKGHCLTNGHIANLAREAKTKLLISSDAHQAEELLDPALVIAIAKGAGMKDEEIQALPGNIQDLLKRLPL